MTDTRRVPSAHDPFGWGIVLCTDPRFSNAVAAWPGANRAIFLRTMTGGVISKVGFEVGTASGNVSVAAYACSGSGLTAVPGTRLATSGSVACPASGLGQVSLGASVSVAAGDWLALTCDNATATFARFTPNSSAFNGGLAQRQDTAHPAPSPIGTLAGTSYIPVLIGVP